MNTAAHPVAPEEVMALLEGELSCEQAQSVSAHLGQCPECAAWAAEFRTVSGGLSDWKVPPVPESLSHRLVFSPEKVRSGMKTSQPSIFIRASFWSWRQWAVGIAVGAVVLIGFASVLFESRQFATTARHERRERLQGLDEVAKQPAPPAAVESKALKEYSRNESVSDLAASEGDAVTEGYGSGNGRAPSDFQQPMIARTVSLSIIVKDFAAARANLEVILARHHGYAAQLNASTAENAARSLNGSLRVPAGELGTTVAELKSLGRVQNELQNGEEVTQQHADLVARLKNSRETERRLQAILAERTGKISDVLAVEQEIARVRGEIEQMEAEQKSLEHRVDFATVDLNLTEEYKAQLVIPPLSVGTRLHNALVEGSRNASETVLGIVLFFAEYTLTLLIWVMILGLPFVLLWRRYRRALAV
jgi:hypothetical protein